MLPVGPRTMSMPPISSGSRKNAPFALWPRALIVLPRAVDHDGHAAEILQAANVHGGGRIVAAILQRYAGDRAQHVADAVGLQALDLLQRDDADRRQRIDRPLLGLGGGDGDGVERLRRRRAGCRPAHSRCAPDLGLRDRCSCRFLLRFALRCLAFCCSACGCLAAAGCRACAALSEIPPRHKATADTPQRSACALLAPLAIFIPHALSSFEWPRLAGGHTHAPACVCGGLLANGCAHAGRMIQQFRRSWRQQRNQSLQGQIKAIVK